MTTLNVSLPKPLRDYIERRARKDHFSASEYIRNLIRADMQRRRDDVLDEYLRLCLRQIEAGDVGTSDIHALIAEEKAKLRGRRKKRQVQ